MRFFRYGSGDVLAIALPDSMRKPTGIKEGDDYEFIEIAPGALFLAGKDYLSTLARRSVAEFFSQKIIQQTTVPSPAKAAEEAARTTNQAGQNHDQAHYQAATQQQQAQKPGASPFQPASQPQRQGSNHFEDELERNGYMILDEEGAKAASRILEAKIKEGAVLGVRGFDKKFYVVTRTLYEDLSRKIAAAVPDADCSADEIAAATKANAEACTAVLQVMKEEGDVIERKKGTYRLVK